jgi:ABC-2 type transport system permease protein
MRNFSAMIWIEARKALRSRMPWGTALGALFMPVGIAFLIFVARNPEISQKLGLIGAKANLLAYANTDWAAYLGLTGLILAAGGFIIFVLILSWVFGREFTDGTLKDMLAVPVQRGSILLAKMSVAAIWSLAISLQILIVSLAMGALIQLPGGSPALIAQGSGVVAVTALLEIVVTLPFAFFASVGRGYLLPFGVAMLTLLITNLEALAGFGEYFPWAIPGIFAQGKTPLTPLSFWIVPITGLAGMLATYLWWRFADQNR